MTIHIPDGMFIGVDGSESDGARPRPFALHLSLDLGGCDQAILANPKRVHGWVSVVCEAIEMTPHGDGFCEQFGEGDLYGTTLLHPIKTSSIGALHVHCASEVFGDAVFAEVISCRIFDTDLATQVTVDYFRATDVETCVRLRRAPVPGSRPFHRR